MKNLLVGNGINIQFDNTNYTTQQIDMQLLNCRLLLMTLLERSVVLQIIFFS